jgi:hypothetical protein
MTQNAKGPAATAIAPDHGSTNPTKDQEMNSAKPITVSAPAPAPAFSRRQALGLFAAGTAFPAVAIAAAAAAPQEDPIQLAVQAAQRLADAMELVTPGGDWDVIVNHDTRCAIIVDKKRDRGVQA